MVASLLEDDFSNPMLYVLLYVNYVKEVWKMSDMCSLGVQKHYSVGIVTGLSDIITPWLQIFNKARTIIQVHM